MAGTLISYRGGDAPGHAGRLSDRLRARLPKHPVRKDVSQVAPGEDFVQAIENAVASSDTVLVVMGRDWVSSTSTGGRRLDDPNDPVRLEIAAALQLKRRLIPVLVGGASMPLEQALPSDIRGLVRRQAVELRDASWDADVENLVAAIGPQKAAAPREPGKPNRYRRAAIFGGILGVVLPILIALVWIDSDSSHSGSPGLPGVRIHPDLTLVSHSNIGAMTALPGRIASLNNDEVTLWNLASGESESIYKEHANTPLAGLPDGRIALGDAGYIKLLNVDQRKVEETIDLHDPNPNRTDQGINRLMLLRDGRLLSFSYISIGLFDWKAHEGHVIRGGTEHRHAHVAVLSGGRLAFVNGTGVGVWNTRERNAEILLEGQPDDGPAKDLALLPDGRIATTSERRVLALWNLETGKEKVLRPANDNGVLFDDRLFTLPDGRLAEVGSESIEVWNGSRDRPDSAETIPRNDSVWTADPLLLADGRLILPSDNGGIVLWNPRTAKLDAILEGHTKTIRHLLLLDDGRLASASEDGTIRIWKIPSSGRGR